MVSYIVQRLKFTKYQRDFKTWHALKYMLACGCFVWEDECYRKCVDFSFLPKT